jgi:sugar transferase (PEP-CTERM/EpsH1 system associated)
MGDILFLCHRVPFPPDRGDKIRSYHLLEALRRIARVHVGCLAEDARDFELASELDAVAATSGVFARPGKVKAGLTGLARGQSLLVSLFDNAPLHAWVKRTLAERPISCVVAYSAQMAHFVPPLPAGTGFLMDFVDFDSAKYAAYGRAQYGPMGWVNRREGRLLFDFEREVAARAGLCTFVSEAEAALFRDAAGFDARKVRAIESGVALDSFSPDAAFERLTAVERGTGPLIVFTGQMDYRPNIEAVCSFAAEALPLIREVRPDARFAIVGRNPARAVTALEAQPGVLVTGAVPDVRGWLAAADVVVAPLRIARGIQNKVLEAMPVTLSLVLVCDPE